ncbi:MAG: serine/threonine-protein kinase, partial [Gemmatimonadales bacterium]
MTAPFDRLKSALGDRYELEREVGQGGMATVFLARDLKHDRKVAIKVLRPELAASLGADRFLREIRVAANLQHPNILGLYDSGETEGLLFYVMPFVEGESLRDRLTREQQLPIHDALQITREAAEALEYAHSRGIVHRDIKPENILLLGGHALVADFGIARAVSQAGGEKLTQTGMAIGTPHYMSPEQSLGSEHVDARSDVYSLGCVLYELLIGQPPFTGPNAMAILARHSMEVVPSLQVVRPSVPDDVEDAIMRALEKTPADRFQTMKEFCECLAESEAESTMMRTSARRAATAARRIPTREMRTMAPGPAPDPMRKRIRVGGAILGALLLAGGVAVGFQKLGQSGSSAGAPLAANPDASRVAVLYFRDLGGKDSLRSLADGLTEGLIRELASVRTLDVISKNGVAPYRDGTTSRDSIARALKVGTIIDGDVERSGDRMRVTVRLVDGPSGAEVKRVSFERPAGDLIAIRDSLAGTAAQELRELLGPEVKLREQRASTKNVAAWLLLQRGEQARKRADSLKAISGHGTATVDAAFDEADTLFAQAHAADTTWVDPLVERGQVAHWRSRLAVQDPARAEPLIKRGMRFADQALALDPQSADALELRGSLEYWRWLLTLEPDKDKSDALLKSAQQDLEAAVKLQPSQASAWGVLSHLYNQTGSGADVVLAARRAYEEDAYLSNADVIIFRLFFG